jgi:hypothetical protein
MANSKQVPVATITAVIDGKNDTRVAFAVAADDHGVPPDINRRVFTAQTELRGAFRNSVRVGVRLGHALSMAKEACRHGEFRGWLKTHFTDGSARQAQRFMELGREYPDPEKVPPLSLREALRLIAGRKEAGVTQLAHERLSQQTITAVSCCLGEMQKIIETKVVGQLEVEGVTSKHVTMKQARQIEGSIRRLRENLLDQIEPQAHKVSTVCAAQQIANL